MNVIDTTLTTSGNSVAVRLPKELLKMSGLGHNVTLEAREGQIIISKAKNPREGWEEQIEALVGTEGDPSRGFDDMKVAENDGLEDLPSWNGPTYEEWLKDNADNGQSS
jgi:antitoxin component of MazEF toxin-antitoxin module